MFVTLLFGFWCFWNFLCGTPDSNATLTVMRNVSDETVSRTVSRRGADAAPPSGSNTEATKECTKALKELQALEVKSRTKASPQYLPSDSHKATTWKRALVSALPLQAAKGF